MTHPFFTEALARERIEAYRRVPASRGAGRTWREPLGRALIRVGTRLAPAAAPRPVPAAR